MHHKHIYMCTNIQTCVNNILLSISLSFPSFVRTLAEIVVVLFLFLADRPFLPLGGLFSVFNVKCAERERESRRKTTTVRRTDDTEEEGQAHSVCEVRVFPNCWAMPM